MSTTRAAPSATPTREDPPGDEQALRSPGAVPGEGGLWLFLGGDILVFTLLFVTALVVRADQPGMYARSSETLHQGIGTLNTIVLLTGSALVALAVRAARRERLEGARRLVDGALACAVAFLALKAVEWTSLLTSGHTPSANDFYELYFLLTGLHLLHVSIGIGALLALRAQLGRPGGPTSWRVVEGGGCYWHMVDLLWLVLFPLLYLLP